MRLSDKRIKKLAKTMASTMVARGVVKLSGSESALAEAVSRTLMLDQKLEGDIEEEARAFVARQRNLPPPGTGEYAAAFSNAKRAIAHRKGFVL